MMCTSVPAEACRQNLKGEYSGKRAEHRAAAALYNIRYYFIEHEVLIIVRRDYICLRKHSARKPGGLRLLI